MSLSSWFAVLAAVSAPLVATAHGVTDTHAVASGASEQLVGDSFAAGSSLASHELATAALEWAHEEDGEEEAQHGRALLRSSRRKRGVARAAAKAPAKKKSASKKKKSSPKKKKSSSKKKKSSSKKKKKSASKKKKSSAKKSPKKSPPKKKQSAVAGARRIGGGGGGGGKAIGKSKLAHGTFFSGMGTPTGGCGVPPSKAYDDRGTPLPFVALNTNSEFANGNNCGRWIEIKLGQNCEGGGNSAWSICNGGRWVSDGMTGDTIYGYVMDSCADSNFWCQSDTNHLDISKSYLTAMGYVSNWNGRKVSWKYMTDTPSGWVQSDPKFMWKSGSKWIKNGKGFYAAIVIHNTSNGIGSVQQQIAGKWVNIQPLNHLGNMWVLQKPSDNEYRLPNGGTGQYIKVRVMDKDGEYYGSYSLKWMCGGTGACSTEVDAPTMKM